MKLFELFGIISVENQEANEDIDETDKKASGLGNTFKKVGSGIGKAGKVIGVGIGVATAAAGVATTQIAETTDRIDKMSQNMGLSVESFQEWDFVLGQTGADIEQLQGGLAALTEKAVDAKNGGEGNAEAFAKLGISMEDLQGMTQEDILENTIRGLQDMTNETERAALASELLGGAGEEMGALLNLTGQDIDNMKQQAHDLGIVMGDDVVAQGVAMTDQIDVMKRSLLGVAAEALVPLMPVMMDLMQSFVQILPPIIEFIRPLIEKLVPVITKIIEKLMPVFIRLLDALMPVLDPLIDAFLMLVEALLPVIEALLPLVEVLLPPLVSLIEILVPLIEGLANVLSKTLVEAVQFVTTVFEDFFNKLEPVFEMLKGIADVAGEAIGKVGDVVGGAGDFIGGAFNKSKEISEGFFGGIADLLPQFDVGTPYVPNDMVAMVHKGERILTADENRNFGNQGFTIKVEGATFINEQQIGDLMDMGIKYITGQGVQGVVG